MEDKPPRKDAHPERRPEPRQCRDGPRAIADWTDRLTRRPFGKRGFAEAALLANWPAIVGPSLAPGTLPLKIAFPPGQRAGGTLHLRASSGALALEIQHLEPLIVQRINSHFGYAAVTRLTLTQGAVPLRKRPAPRPPAPLIPAIEQRLDTQCGGIEDVDLRNALTALGRSLAARR